MCVNNVQTDNLIQGIATGAARHYASTDRAPSSIVRIKVSGVRPHPIHPCNVCKKLEGLVNGICAGCNRILEKEYKERETGR